MSTETLKKLNFEQSLGEPSLYTRITKDARVLVTCIVDDFVVTGNDSECQRFKKEIAKGDYGRRTTILVSQLPSDT